MPHRLMESATIEASVVFAVPCTITFHQDHVEVIPLASINKYNGYFMRVDSNYTRDDPIFVFTMCSGEIHITTWSRLERASFMLGMAENEPLIISLNDLKLSENEALNDTIDNLLRAHIGSMETQ